MGRASVPPARRNVSNPVSSESEWHGVGRPRAESARIEIDDLEGSCFRSESGESFELSVQRGCVLECRSSFNFHRLIAAAPRAPLVCHSTHTARSNLPARSPTATRPRHTGYTYPRATLDRIAIAHWLGLAPSVTHATGRISRHVRTVSRLRPHVCRACARRLPSHSHPNPQDPLMHARSRLSRHKQEPTGRQVRSARPTTSLQTTYHTRYHTRPSCQRSRARACAAASTLSVCCQPAAAARRSSTPLTACGSSHCVTE